MFLSYITTNKLVKSPEHDGQVESLWEDFIPLRIIHAITCVIMQTNIL